MLHYCPFDIFESVLKSTVNLLYLFITAIENLPAFRHYEYGRFYGRAENDTIKARVKIHINMSRSTIVLAHLTATLIKSTRDSFSISKKNFWKIG